MSDIHIHIAQIKQDIALMTHHGHIADFGMITCVDAIEYNLDRIAAIDDTLEKRQT